jgi:hypothetical protein
LLRLDATGAVKSEQPAPDVGMLNGMAQPRIVRKDGARRGAAFPRPEVRSCGPAALSGAGQRQWGSAWSKGPRWRDDRFRAAPPIVDTGKLRLRRCSRR